MAKPHIPKNYEIQPLKPGQKAKDKVTCGTCGLSWDDAKVTSITPTPGGRCPFEAFHVVSKEKPKNIAESYQKQVCGKGEEVSTVLVDLIADLLHYSDTKNVNFDRAYQCARRHHKAERTKS